MRKAVVLDTSAFIMDYHPLAVDAEQYTVPQVVEELDPDSTCSLRLRTAVQQGHLILRQPSGGCLKRVEECSSLLGDAIKLSLTDRQVLALALELVSEDKTVVLLTDDYSVQNVADVLGIDYSSLSTVGISRRFKWIIYCPACHRTYPKGPFGTCEICGTELKRRVLKSSPAKKRWAKGKLV